MSSTPDTAARPTALITGASRGIGRAIATRLAALDYDLALMSRNEADLAAVVEACAAHGVRTASFPGDVTDRQYIDEALATTDRTLGPIDVLVNNAGMARREAVQEASIADWETVMDVNFGATVYLARQVVPGMIERRRGAIINISSISGRNTNAGGGAYCASKHALNGFSGCLYEDVRDYGIKVSTIMPGFVDTRLTGDLGLVAGHMIRAEDVADSVAYVLGTSANCCPTEIVLRPQLRP